jgi:two-component system response regulator AtoC
MLAPADTRVHAAAAPAVDAGPSIPIDMLGIDEHQAPNLANLSLKKIRKKALDRVEKEVISYVLDKTGWNRSKATKILKISYKTLLYKIKDLEIFPPPDAGE